MADNDFSELMLAGDPAMVIVTTMVEDERAGCLVGFHCQSGIDPQRYSVWLSKANHTYRVALRARYFAVHVLSSDDYEVAERFGTQSGESTDKFAGLEVGDGPGGVPVLTDLANRVIVERLTMVDDGSDHVCVSTRVLSARHSDDLEPLRLSQVTHLQAGHGVRERAISPRE